MANCGTINLFIHKGNSGIHMAAEQTIWQEINIIEKKLKRWVY